MPLQDNVTADAADEQRGVTSQLNFEFGCTVGVGASLHHPARVTEFRRRIWVESRRSDPGERLITWRDGVGVDASEIEDVSGRNPVAAEVGDGVPDANSGQTLGDEVEVEPVKAETAGQ